MNTINNDNRPCIIIPSVNPESDRKKIILALTASIRWYIDYLSRRGNNDISDQKDLHSIAKWLEYACNIVITANCSSKKQLTIFVDEVFEDENRDLLMAGLIGAIRWYANSDEGARYITDEVDQQNLSMLTKLQNSLFKYSNK